MLGQQLPLHCKAFPLRFLLMQLLKNFIHVDADREASALTRTIARALFIFFLLTGFAVSETAAQSATVITVDPRLVSVPEATTVGRTTVAQQVRLILSVPPAPLLRGSTFAITLRAVPPPPGLATLSVALSLTGVGVETTGQTAILTNTVSSLDLIFTVPADAPQTLMLATETTADASRVRVTAEVAASVTVIQPQPVSLMLSVPETPLMRGSIFTTTLTADPAPPADAPLRVQVNPAGGDAQTTTLTSSDPEVLLTLTVPLNAPAVLMLGTETNADVRRVTVTETSATVTVIQPPTVRLMLSAPLVPLERSDDFQVTLQAVPPPETTLTVTITLTGGASQTATLTAAISSLTLDFTVPADALADLVLATQTEADPRRVIVVETSAPVTVSQPQPVSLTLNVPLTPLLRGSTFAVTLAADPAPPAAAALSVALSLAGTGVTTATRTVSLTEEAPSQELTLTVPTNAPAELMLATQTTADVRRVTVTETAEMVTVTQPLPVSLMLRVPPAPLLRSSTFAVTLTAEPPPLAEAALSVVLRLTGTGVVPAVQTVPLTADAPSQELDFTVPANAPAELMLATETTADTRRVTVTEAAEMVAIIQPQPVRLMLDVPRVPLLRSSTFAVTLTADPALSAEAALSVALALTGTGVTTAVRTVSLTAAAPSQELDFTVPADAPAALMLATETTADVRRVTVTETAEMVTVIQPQPVSLVLSVPAEPLTRGSTFAVTLTADPAPVAEGPLSVQVSPAEGDAQTTTLTSSNSSVSLTLTVPLNAPAALMLATRTTADVRRVMVTEAAATVTVIQPPTVSLALSVPSMPLMRGSTFSVTLEVTPPPATTLTVQVTPAGGVSQMATLTPEVTTRVLTLTVPLNAPETLTLATVTQADPLLVIVTEAASEVTVTQPPSVSLALDVPQIPLLRGATFEVILESLPPPTATLSVTLRLTGDGVETVTRAATLTMTAASQTLSFTVPENAPQALMLETMTETDARQVRVMEASVTLEVIQPQPVRLVLTPQETLPLRGTTFMATVTAEPPPPAEAPLSVLLVLTGTDVTTAVQTVPLTAEAPSQELTFAVPADAPETLMLATETTADVRRVMVTEAAAMVTVMPILPIRLVLSAPQIPLARGSTFMATVTADPAPPVAAPLSVALSLTGNGVETAVQTTTLTMEDPSQELNFTVPADASQILMLATETTADVRQVAVTEAAVTIPLRRQLDFVAPDGTVNVDDLVFVLRYFVICPDGPDGPDGCDTGSLLTGLPPLIAVPQGPIMLPDVTGDGAGDRRDIVILIRYLSGLRGSLLLPDVPGDTPEEQEQERDRLQAYIRRVLKIE